MADPLTWKAVADIGMLAITAGGAVASGVGSAQEGAASREDGARQGQALRQQNSRLLQGPGAPPAYSQNVQGYGFADPATGQYATTNQMPVFTDGSSEVAAPVMLNQQPVTVVAEPAQGTMQPVAAYDTPDMRAAYQRYVQQFQQPTPVAPSFAQPVWFDDGPREYGATQPPVWFTDGPQNG